MGQLKRFIVERAIKGVGNFSKRDLCSAARATNEALDTMGRGIQWEHSYVTGDKTFCIYLAESEEAIRWHSELSGIAVASITEVTQIIDPLTAND